jgi:hypothetical protein
MANPQDITTRELAIRTSIDAIAPDDTLLVKTVGVHGRLYEKLSLSTGLKIIGNPGSKVIIATGESTPGDHHLTHEPGGGDEVGVLALRQLENDPSPESGVTIVYVLANDTASLCWKDINGVVHKAELHTNNLSALSALDAATGFLYQISPAVFTKLNASAVLTGIGAVGGSGDATYLALFSDATHIADSILYQSGGKICISNMSGSVNAIGLDASKFIEPCAALGIKSDLIISDQFKTEYQIPNVDYGIYPGMLKAGENPPYYTRKNAAGMDTFRTYCRRILNFFRCLRQRLRAIYRENSYCRGWHDRSFVFG